MIFETVSLLDRSVHSFVFFIHSVVSLENKDGTMIICFFFRMYQFVFLVVSPPF